MSFQRATTVLAAIPTNRATSTVTGGEIDLQGYVEPGVKEIKAFLDVITKGADTDETITVKIQESADTVVGNYADITGAAFTAVTQEGAVAAVQSSIHFVTNKRYVRAIATLAGTTPAFDFGVYLLVTKRTQ